MVSPSSSDIETHAMSPPLPWAATYTGSGPISLTISASMNCITVYDVMVTIVGAAIENISRSG